MWTNERGFTRTLCGTRGASILEFAIVAPIVFLFIFGFIDIARYWQIRSAAAAVAQYGVGLAVVQPGLDRDANTATSVLATEYEPAREAVINAVKSKSKDLILAPLNNAGDATLTGLDLVVPFRDDLTKEPITVQVRVPYRPMFGSLIGFPSVDINITAAGYREPKRVAALPVPTDCWGVPYDATNPPGGGSYQYGCPCENGELSFFSGGSCVCSDSIYFMNGTSIQEDGKCGCGEGTVPLLQYSSSGEQSDQTTAMLNAMSALCCPEGTPKTCPNGLVRDIRVGECGCHCMDGADLDENSNCVCGDPLKKYTNDGCVCKTPEESNGEVPECTDGTQLDPNTCSCSCKGGTIQTSTDGCGDAHSKCVCNGKATVVDGNCVCGLTCTPPMVVDEASCQCICPADQVKQANGTCGCPANKVAQDGICVCDPDIAASCGPEELLDPNSCTCRCPNNGVASGGHCCPQGAAYNAGTGQCGCTNPKQSIVGNSCKCPSSAPPGTSWGAYQDSACNWHCPPNTIESGGACCPTNSTVVPGSPPSCACNDSQRTWNIYAGACVCSPSLPACENGKVRNPTTCQCVCPTGSTPDGDSCSCTDTSRIYNSGQCECKACGPGFTRKPGSCECVCNAPGLKVINGFCAGVWCGEACSFSITPDGEVNCDCQHG